MAKKKFLEFFNIFATLATDTLFIMKDKATICKIVLHFFVEIWGQFSPQATLGKGAGPFKGRAAPYRLRGFHAAT